MASMYRCQLSAYRTSTKILFDNTDYAASFEQSACRDDIYNAVYASGVVRHYDDDFMAFATLTFRFRR